MDKKKRILLVDDENDILEILSLRIKSFGNYDVDTANDGFEAAKKVIDTDYDLILLDIMMPGIDGIEVCLSLKESPKTASIPIIIVSALNNAKIILTTKQAGANDYIVKPFTPEILKTKIEKYLPCDPTDHEEEIVDAIPIEDNPPHAPTRSETRRQILQKIDTVSTLPTIPETLLHLSQNIGDLGTNLGRFACADLGFSTDILLVANSSFYSPKQPVVSIQQGISLIGTKVIIENIKKLIEKKQLLDLTARKHLYRGFFYSSLAQAYSAKFIAENEDYSNTDEIYSLVFLKNIGSFFLMNYFPEEYDNLFDTISPKNLIEQEKQVLGISSLEISDRIATRWRLPSTVHHFIESHVRNSPATDSISKAYAISLIADFCAKTIGYTYQTDTTLPAPPSFLEQKYPSFFSYSRKLTHFVKQQINIVSKIYKYPQPDPIKPDCPTKKIFLIGHKTRIHAYRLMLESLDFEIIHRDWDNLVDSKNLLYDYIIADSTTATKDDLSVLFQRKHLPRGIVLVNDQKKLKPFLEKHPTFSIIKKPAPYDIIIENLNR